MARSPHENDLLFVPAGAAREGLPASIELPPSRRFPPATASTSEGLVCLGGRLVPEWLLDAYSHGLFPWPMWEDEPMAWWSLDPRAIIELDGLHISRRLRRTLRGGKFVATCNQAFASVIRACAVGSGREEGTWLTPAMIDAYCELHRLGHAHSVEIWRSDSEAEVRSPSLTTEACPPSPIGRGVGGEGEPPNHVAPHPNPLPLGAGMVHLVGGIYGVAIGGFFAAESMFHRERDASKVALVHLVSHLRARGFQLLDIQQWTSHTSRLGAIEIPRLEYLHRLAKALKLPVTF